MCYHEKHQWNKRLKREHYRNGSKTNEEREHKMKENYDAMKAYFENEINKLKELLKN